MGIYVTDTGFVKKTLAEIQAELEAVYKSVFGDAIDLDPTGPFGQIIGIGSKRESDLWDAAEEIYTSRDPDEATGTSLDNIMAQNGLTRIDDTFTTVTNVYLIGDEGTVVAVGKQVRIATEEDILYALDASVTITKTAARFIELVPDTPSGGGGTVYTVTIDATPYTYTSDPGDTVAIVIDSLINLIVAGGTFGGTSTNLNDLLLEIAFNPTDFAITFSGTLSETRLGSGGDFTGLTAGSNPVPSTALDTIVTPVTNWDEVFNANAGVTGALAESDIAARKRREQEFQTGLATDNTIANSLIENVDNVSSAKVTSNRTDLTDADGRPPHSFETVVEGGSDQDVADDIWRTQPAGIQSYGNTTQNVTDSEGETQVIKFSRPETLYIWVKVRRELYDEEAYPSDGDAQIKQAIIDWAVLNQPIGKDVFRGRLKTPVYTIPGIGDVEIELDDTATPAGPPTYADADIAVSARQATDWAATRIVVETL